jgi:hypothetical protein
MARQSDQICAEGYCLERSARDWCLLAQAIGAILLRGLVGATQIVVLDD